MKILITGAGQIGNAIIRSLRATGDDVTVIRRSTHPIEGVRVISGDAGERALLEREARAADAIMHCIHAPYTAQAWRKELPHREQAVMDVAATLGIPVIFPESVYAFGTQAHDLHEGAPIHPCSPLGDVRAELLDARATHAAHTASIVAADLVGKGASAKASVPTMSIVNPTLAGKACWTFGSPDTPHAMTFVSDLAEAMIHVAREHTRVFASNSSVTLNAPSPAPINFRELARTLSARANVSEPKIHTIPAWALSLTGLASPTLRSLSQQRYLWGSPSRLAPGALTKEHGLESTRWSEASFA
ncbi:NAD-dependent epimerase/dehydratase family protein [Dermabacter sp. Marseille-Q3180]|uniref:NAD-dependent epimerase/dehydratase family protein n=1 Tax=Dermabacter sp. Marseille-Q3180 TaxID=2758090 RepID=UPI0020244EBB|nr:NAD-dependent epimerase/dehydratase family protein [Dermabacter sp. Marseille-Q3180]